MLVPHLAFVEGLGAPSHWLVLLIVGVLLFGKRLPDVGRSAGKAVKEFLNAFRGLEDDLTQSVSSGAEERPLIEPPRPPERIASAGPKFEEPAPQDRAS